MKKTKEIITSIVISTLISTSSYSSSIDNNQFLSLGGLLKSSFVGIIIMAEPMRSSIVPTKYPTPAPTLVKPILPHVINIQNLSPESESLFDNGPRTLSPTSDSPTNYPTPQPIFTLLSDKNVNSLTVVELTEK